MNANIRSAPTSPVGSKPGAAWHVTGSTSPTKSAHTAPTNASTSANSPISTADSRRERARVRAQQELDAKNRAKGFFRSGLNTVATSFRRRPAKPQQAAQEEPPKRSEEPGEEENNDGKRNRGKRKKKRHRHKKKRKEKKSDKDGGISDSLSSESEGSADIEVEGVTVGDNETTPRLTPTLKDLQDAQKNPGQPGEPANPESRKKKRTSRNHQPSFCARYRTMIVIITIVVMVIAGVIIGFSGSKNNDDTPAQKNPETLVPSSSPTIEISEVTNSPTNAPTSLPPKCNTIANGEPIEGQELLKTHQYGVQMDISTEFAIGPEKLLDNVKTMIQYVIAPALAGCGGGRLLVNVNGRTAFRGSQRKLIENVIASANVTEIKVLRETNCNNQTLTFCHRLLATLDVYLSDSSVGGIALGPTISKGFDDLFVKLDLGYPFKTL